MKTILKILLYFVLFVLAVLIIAPLAFKGKIMNIAREQINNTVDAQVDFTNLSLSFFRDFPNLSVSLEGLSIVGNEPFQGDTLVAFDAFMVSVNALSLTDMKNVEVKKILLDKPVINGIVSADGTTNWDIFPESEPDTVPEPADTDTSEFNASLDLKSFMIKNAKLAYTDHASGMEALIKGFDFTLKGNFAKDFSVLDIDSRIASVDFIMGNIRYVKQAAILMDINIDANLEENIFIIKENKIGINDLMLSFDGNFAMPNEQDITMDMKFATNNPSFKSILSMVPAVYLTGFEGVQTDGTFQLSGDISGTLNEKQTPSANIKLNVNDAMFNYPDLPKSVDNINVDIAVHYDGVQNDNTTIDVNQFHLEIAENPIDINLHVATPISDMLVNGKFTADMQLGAFADALPLEETTVDGYIFTNIDFMARMSQIDNQEYEKIKTQGQVTMKDLTYLSSDFSQGITITSALLNFSPQFVEMEGFNAKIGNSDIGMYGKVENFIPYVFDDGIINGRLELSSQMLDLNEFMPDEAEEAETEEPTDTASTMEVIEVPKNIDFTFTSQLAHVKMQKMDITNMKGLIIVKDGKVLMENLSMNMVGGEIKLNGLYSTEDIENPMIDFGVKATSIDIPQTFETFVFIQEMIPIGAHTSGRLSTSFDMTSFLANDMTPVLSSIVADGFINTKNIRINNASTFNKIGSALKTDKFDEMSLKDFMAEFEIRNGRVLVKPFETKFGNTNLFIEGDQGIDQTLNYDMKITMPRSNLGAGANELISGLASGLSGTGLNLEPGDNLTFNVAVGGTFDNPTVTPKLAGAEKGDAKEEVKKQVKAEVKKEIQQKKDEAKAKASAEADKIIKEAEQKAAQIRKSARASADKIRSEADDKADKLVKEAKNPIAKKAAEVSADKIRDEADAKADKVIQEGDARANDVIKKAKQEADKLK